MKVRVNFHLHGGALSCVMLLPGSHHSLTGCVISLASSSVSQTFKPETFRAPPPPLAALDKPPLRSGGLPWAGLVVGWHRATVPPNSARSGKSHRAHTAASSGVYRSPPHDGCTATRVYSETSPGRWGRIPDPCDKQTAAKRRVQQIAVTGRSPAERADENAAGAGTHGRRTNSEWRWVSAVLPSERLLCRHEHGNYFPAFVPLWLVNMRPYCPPHRFFLSGRF